MKLQTERATNAGPTIWGEPALAALVPKALRKLNPPQHCRGCPPPGEPWPSAAHLRDDGGPASISRKSPDQEIPSSDKWAVSAPKSHPQNVWGVAPSGCKETGTTNWVTSSLPTAPALDAEVLRERGLQRGGGDSLAAVRHATTACACHRPPCSAAERSRARAYASRAATHASS